MSEAQRLRSLGLSKSLILKHIPEVPRNVSAILRRLTKDDELVILILRGVHRRRSL